MISLTSKGSTKNLDRFLKKMSKRTYAEVLNDLGSRGVSALASSTPKDSGITASSWSFEIEKSGGYTSIIWTNSHINQGVPIAIILQYGHGTGTGGYVQGQDYINPALRPIFDEIAEQLWLQVKSA